MDATQNSLLYIFVVGTSFIVLMLTFIFIYIILYQKKAAKHTKQLQEKELEKQYQVYDALLKGEEKERKRLAEELHDGVGAKLSGVKMSVEFLQQELSQKMFEHTSQVVQSLNESINELREISHNLQPSAIGIKGLKQSIQDFMDNLNKKKQTSFSFYWHANEMVFRNEQSELNIYRISTELLSNIFKHAKASEASLQIIVQENELQLIAEDNGIGFDIHKAAEGIGLINLRNRVDHEKGTLNIDSQQQHGTTIIISIPIYHPE
jgi:two-component system, NarL family, sensor kinase